MTASVEPWIALTTRRRHGPSLLCFAPVSTVLNSAYNLARKLRHQYLISCRHNENSKRYNRCLLCSFCRCRHKNPKTYPINPRRREINRHTTWCIQKSESFLVWCDGVGLAWLGLVWLGLAGRVSCRHNVVCSDDVCGGGSDFESVTYSYVQFYARPWCQAVRLRVAMRATRTAAARETLGTKELLFE